MSSSLNKTINIPLEQGQEYLERCLRLTAQADLEAVLDRLILGDAFEVMPLLPAGFADLVIVDPPYNISKDYHGNRFNVMSSKSYEEYTEKWINAVKPLMNKNASMYVCCDWRSSMIIGSALERHFHIRNRITWQREKGRGSRKNWKNSMEDIWFVTNSGNYTFNIESVMQRRRVIAPYHENGSPKDWEKTSDGNFRNTCPSNFWDDISVPFWSMPENTAHPAQKPEKLLAKLILASSDSEDVVLDPFGGSGSTAVTACKLGRHFVSIEQNELYCVWAQRRLELAQTDKSIQGYADGVFWERNTAARLMKTTGRSRSNSRNP